METHTEHRTIRTFASEVLPEVMTTDPEFAKTIEWADAHPVVWKIVTGTRSKAFGRNSCEYIGWAQRCAAPEAVLERARHFHECVDPELHRGLNYRSGGIWGWRARFTFEHYQAKGFKGGFFQRFDGRFDRDCMTLDYTPETLPQVVRNFMEWAKFRPLATETVKVDRTVLDAEIVEEALRLRSCIWDPPVEIVTERGLFSSIR